MTNPDETNGAIPDQTSTSGAQSQSPSASSASSASPDLPASVHDSVFYKLFSDRERVTAELKCILPNDLVEVIEWSTLKIEPNRFVDPNLANHLADIWLSVKVRQKKVAIHLLFEHSSGPKNHELLQALRYQVKFWEKEQKSANDEGFRPLTPILTLILHHSETGWRGRSRFGDYFGLDEELELLFRPYMVDFGVFVDDLSPLDADVLLSRPVPMDVQVMLFALRFGRSGPQLLQELPKVSPLLGKLMGDPTGRLAVHSFLVYIRRVGKIPEAQLRMALDDVFVPVLDPEIAAIWDQIDAIRAGERRGEERGERRGEQRGEQRGIVKGKVATLERLLTLRFGPLSKGALARLQKASMEDLEGIELRVLTAVTLEEALGLAKKTKR
jgi:hypothetical protein